jgi:hypothetical protein
MRTLEAVSVTTAEAGGVRSLSSRLPETLPSVLERLLPFFFFASAGGPWVLRPTNRPTVCLVVTQQSPRVKKNKTPASPTKRLPKTTSTLSNKEGGADHKKDSEKSRSYTSECGNHIVMVVWWGRRNWWDGLPQSQTAGLTLLPHHASPRLSIVFYHLSKYRDGHCKFFWVTRCFLKEQSSHGHVPALKIS